MKAEEETQPAWRQRAVLRGLSAARSRAEKRVQRYLDAAFELMDQKGSTDFTIQEVIERSKQSLRGFYQYFDGKDELLLALFEESMREAVADLQAVAESEGSPIERLRAFTVRLHEWCEPVKTPRKRGAHNRLPISEFSLHLTVSQPERVRQTMVPIHQTMIELLDAAAQAKAIRVKDTQRAALLIQQTVMCGWVANRLVGNPRSRVTAEETWEFCLRGLSG